MSQKIHPTSIRLRGQRTFESSWYEDSWNYLKEFKKDQVIRHTIESLFHILSLNISNLFLGRIFIQKSHKHLVVVVVFYKKNMPQVKRKRLTFAFQKSSHSENQIKVLKNHHVHQNLTQLENLVSLSEKNHLNSLFSQVLFRKKQETRFQFLESLMFYKARSDDKLDQSKIYPLVLKMLYLASLKNLAKKTVLPYQWQKHWNNQNTNLDSQGIEQINSKYFLKTQKTHPFFLYLENALSALLNQSVLVYPLVSRRMDQSAFFLAHQLVDLFEKNQKKKRMPYKLIKKLVSNLSKKCLGIRILCSGRLGGVEMARKFSIKKGQTSLNVFSQRVDFAQHQALTRYGILGIKVWISY